jgi:hypothetical protein
VLFIFLWVRATFCATATTSDAPGLKVFIPSRWWIVFIGTMMQTRFAPLFH